MWVFDHDQLCICWANASGLAFWNVSSIDALGHQAFSGDSEHVKDRLSVISQTLLKRDRLIDTWTLYPNNEPTSVKLQFHRILLEPDRACLLIEVAEQHVIPPDVEGVRLLEATRATSSMITMMSLDGRVLMQNPAALKCFGPPQPADSEVTDLQARWPSLRNLEQFQDVASQNTVSRLDAKVATREGQRTHSITVQRGRDPVTGDPVVFLSEDDISELSSLYRSQKMRASKLRKTVAENTDELERAKGRIDRALEVAAIWDWNVADDKLYFSPNFMQLLQYEPSEFIEKIRTERIKGIIHPDDYLDYQPALTKFLETPDKPISHEMRFVTKSGEYLWIQIEGKAFCDEDGKPLRTAGLLTNITPKKQMEATLLASQKLESIGQLTGGIAHDFNNLLTVILGNAQLLEELGTGNKDLIREIVGAVERGSDLTRHLLAFARKQSLNPVRVDIAQLSQKMCATLFRILSETISITYDGDDDLWDAFADATQVETALLNIALNARDAMPNGGKIIIATENVTIDREAADAMAILAPGDYVKLSVSDTGTGMSEETIAKAFDPFFTTKDVGKGTGLGLSMVLGFSEQSGGTTRICSEPDVGTTISVYLPKAQEQATKRNAVAEPALIMGGGQHIHILEDNEEVSLAVSRMVQSLGYRVSTSTTVAEALLVADRSIDIEAFVVDVILPGGQSGVDFASAVLEVDADANLILMSGFPETQLMRDVTQTMEFVFLPKPFSRAQIAKILADIF